MSKGKFCHCNHLNDIAPKYILRFIQIDIFEMLSHVLFRRVVDKDVERAEATIRNLVLTNTLK